MSLNFPTSPSVPIGSFAPSSTGAFGLTHGSEGESLMVVTGDNTVFNHWYGGNNVGLSVFLKEFTEAVVSGTVPEFGEVF